MHNGSCVQSESCPTWYFELENSVDDTIDNECGQSGTDWWYLEYNGSANGNSCVKCAAKRCPQWSSTSCQGSHVGYAGNNQCRACCTPAQYRDNGQCVDYCPSNQHWNGEQCMCTTLQHYEFIPEWGTGFDTAPPEWPESNSNCNSDVHHYEWGGWDCEFQNESRNPWWLRPMCVCSKEVEVECDSWGNSWVTPWGWGGWCFLAWTPIITSEWPKNIEDVQVWDMVLSYNTATSSIEYNKVTELLVHENNNDELYEVTIDGEVVKVTIAHVFFVVNDKINEYQCNAQFTLRHTKYLKVWDKLLRSDGTYATVENISHHHNYGTVYNLEVENVHNYFVHEWYLVHNAKDQFINEKTNNFTWEDNP